MFFRCFRAELFKMKRNPVTVSHLVIPVIVSALFLFYYAVSGQSHGEAGKVTAFFQAIGVAFPVLIGIFTASTMEQEQNAGAFQNLLSLKSKTAALFSKAVLLILFGLIALMFTAVLFGYGFCGVLGQGSTGIGLYLAAALVMWLSAIPLYLIFEILAYLFGKGISIGIGLFSGLISALFLTNLGTCVWKVVPFSWTARIPDAYLKFRILELSAMQDTTLGNILGDAIDGSMIEAQPGLEMLKTQLPIYLIFAAICFAAYYIFAANYEGSKIAE